MQGGGGGAIQIPGYAAVGCQAGRCCRGRGHRPHSRNAGGVLFWPRSFSRRRPAASICGRRSSKVLLSLPCDRPRQAYPKLSLLCTSLSGSLLGGCGLLACLLQMPGGSGRPSMPRVFCKRRRVSPHCMVIGGAGQNNSLGCLTTGGWKADQDSQAHAGPRNHERGHITGRPLRPRLMTPATDSGRSFEMQEIQHGSSQHAAGAYAGRRQPVERCPATRIGRP